MKLVDLATGSDWIVWIVFVIFAVFSIILLSGHGSWFISGYNTASKEEKEKYDEKKLCRTMGIGKVDKESGKGLSTNDFTTAEKNKLASRRLPWWL